MDISNIAERIESLDDEIDMVYNYSILIEHCKDLKNEIKFGEHPNATKDYFNKQFHLSLIQSLDETIEKLRNAINFHTRNHKEKLPKSNTTKFSINSNDKPFKFAIK